LAFIIRIHHDARSSECQIKDGKYARTYRKTLDPKRRRRRRRRRKISRYKKNSSRRSTEILRT